VAFSGLEQCLWDLRGKAFGVPVYELFGGRLRDRIRNYANINRSTENRNPDGFARTAEQAVAAGFDAIKLAPFDSMPRGLTEARRIEEFIELGIDCAAAVRRVIGPKRDLLIDVHSHFDLAHGIELAKRFEPLNLFWLEEVTPAQPLGWLSQINRAAKMPTAGGESIYGVRGFYPYIAAYAVDIVMPDIKYGGGLLELKKIAAMAEGAGLLVSPHGPASPIGNIAAAHVCVGLPNFHILEYSFGEVPWRAEVIEPPEQIAAGGMLELSGRPGFGIELNEKTLAAHRAG
jgi:galactonate dehydratase